MRVFISGVLIACQLYFPAREFNALKRSLLTCRIQSSSFKIPVRLPSPALWLASVPGHSAATATMISNFYSRIPP
jgi:hypothetical protein